MCWCGSHGQVLILKLLQTICMPFATPLNTHPATQCAGCHTQLAERILDRSLSLYYILMLWAA